MVLSPTLTRPAVLPNREQVHKLFEQGDLVPVYRTLLADLETPVSVYMKLAQTGSVSFLLESVEGGERVGRYSFLGVNPKGVISVKNGEVTRTLHGETTTRPLNDGEDPLHAVEKEFGRVNPVRIEGLPRFVGGAVGMLELRHRALLRAPAGHRQPRPRRAGSRLHADRHAGDLRPRQAPVDHPRQCPSTQTVQTRLTTTRCAASKRSPTRCCNRWSSRPNAANPFDDELRSNVTREAVRGKRPARRRNTSLPGDAFQIVLSQRFSRKTSASPLTIYRALRATNPSPYMFLLRFSDDFTLVGASPEMMVRLEAGTATVRPIAGSRPRGADEADDKRLEAEMLADPKERAEHVMLVDLGRNDLGRVCDYGTVKVTDMMYVERYSHIMHIVSNVAGQAARRHERLRSAARDFPGGHAERRAQSPRDGDHRGTGRHAARRLRRRGRLLQLRRLDGHLHHHPRGADAGRHGHDSGGRGAGRGQRAGD